MRRDPKARRDALQAALRKARIEAGLTQAQVAQRLGRPQSFVSKYETGERRLDVIELADICATLEISLSKLISRFV